MLLRKLYIGRKIVLITYKMKVLPGAGAVLIQRRRRGYYGFRERPGSVIRRFTMFVNIQPLLFDPFGNPYPDALFQAEE